MQKVFSSLYPNMTGDQLIQNALIQPLSPKLLDFKLKNSSELKHSIMLSQKNSMKMDSHTSILQDIQTVKSIGEISLLSSMSLESEEIFKVLDATKTVMHIVSKSSSMLNQELDPERKKSLDNKLWMSSISLLCKESPLSSWSNKTLNQLLHIKPLQSKKTLKISKA